ncbi:hypothetical protein [Cecembia calidifontis]|uniref:hypothetical protein n=1 Tax=Cecembia calidifontis TaxID=1187080 RepID=UPI001A93A114|nr:hypothetical protein [Cecembia calidifontis]
MLEFELGYMGIQLINKFRTLIYGGDLSRCMLGQDHGLTSCSAANIGNLGLGLQVVIQKQAIEI